MTTPESNFLRRTNRRRFLLASCLGLPVLAAADAFLVEPTNLKIVSKRLSKGSPSHRFVHFTDLHFKGDRAYMAEVVRAINRVSPDFVCFTGDLVEDLPYLEEALGFIREIKSPVYGVQGNHEYLCGALDEQIGPAFEATGGAWLSNGEEVTGGGTIHLVGLAARTPRVNPPRPGLKTILLAHYPVWVEKLGGWKYDLTLAGHSHGGQVRLPLLGPLYLPPGVGRYDYGLYQTAAGPLYVNSGIGCMGALIRFNCRPEIAVFEI